MSQFTTLHKHFMALALTIRIAGGNVMYEWPTGCKLWKSKRVTKMVNELGMLKTRINGCAVGLLSTKGREIYKPWTLAASFSEIDNYMKDKVCNRQHVHDQAQQWISPLRGRLPGEPWSPGSRRRSCPREAYKLQDWPVSSLQYREDVRGSEVPRHQGRG